MGKSSGGGSSLGTQTVISDIAQPQKGFITEGLARAEDIAQQPYIPFEGQLFEPPTPDELRGFEQLRADVGTFRPRLQAAEALSAISAAPVTSEKIQTGLSPFQDLLTRRATDEAIRRSQLQKQSDQAKAVGSGGYDRAREHILEAERRRNLETQLSDIDLVGSQTAFDRASALAESNRRAQLAAGQGLAGIAGTGQQLGLTGADALIRQGQLIRRDLEKPRQFGYQQFLEERGPSQFMSPFGREGWFGSYAHGAPYGTTTNTQTFGAPPSGFGQAAGLGLGLASIYGQNPSGWNQAVGSMFNSQHGGLVSLAKGGPVKSYQTGAEEERLQELIQLARDSGLAIDLDAPYFQHNIPEAIRRIEVALGFTKGYPAIPVDVETVTETVPAVTEKRIKDQERAVGGVSTTDPLSWSYEQIVSPKTTREVDRRTPGEQIETTGLSFPSSISASDRGKIIEANERQQARTWQEGKSMQSLGGLQEALSEILGQKKAAIGASERERFDRAARRPEVQPIQMAQPRSSAPSWDQLITDRTVAPQSANDKLDESLGERRGKESTKKQSYEARRDESISEPETARSTLKSAIAKLSKGQKNALFSAITSGDNRMVQQAMNMLPQEIREAVQAGKVGRKDITWNKGGLASVKKYQQGRIVQSDLEEMLFRGVRPGWSRENLASKLRQFDPSHPRYDEVMKPIDVEYETDKIEEKYRIPSDRAQRIQRMMKALPSYKTLIKDVFSEEEMPWKPDAVDLMVQEDTKRRRTKELERATKTQSTAPMVKGRTQQTLTPSEVEAQVLQDLLDKPEPEKESESEPEPEVPEESNWIQLLKGLNPEMRAIAAQLLQSREGEELAAVGKGFTAAGKARAAEASRLLQERRVAQEEARTKLAEDTDAWKRTEKGQEMEQALMAAQTMYWEKRGLADIIKSLEENYRLTAEDMAEIIKRLLPLQTQTSLTPEELEARLKAALTPGN